MTADITSAFVFNVGEYLWIKRLSYDFFQTYGFTCLTFPLKTTIERWDKNNRFFRTQNTYGRNERTRLG
jgi:hypothetical protein